MTLLLGSFAVFLLLKVPVSFALLFCSVLFMIVNDIPMMVAVQRLAAGPDSFPLMAVPFFILAGSIMNSSGITKKIFDFCDILTKHITGGLGHANILASVIFAGMSGTAIADAGGLGAIELKAMKDAGYDEDFSLAITGASSTIGPIIPPSLPAVIFGVVAEVSVGRLFIGGFIPGLLMAIALGILVYIQCKKRGYARRPRATAKEIFTAVKEAFFPLLTPILIIGGIMTGVFTPTEAAIVAVFYALILGFAYKEIRVSDLPRFLKETANTTISVIFIVASASLFGWILASQQIPQMLSEYFISIISNKVMALLAINILLLIAGTFMETIAALTILTPVLMPVVLKFGIDPVHFGVIMILNLMIGLLTPPVGMVLYVLSSVSKVPFERIAKACMPYVVVLIISLFIITYVPQLVLFLPNLVLK